MTSGVNEYYYSTKYEDDEYEYRHVHVTKKVAKSIPKNRLLTETEWRNLGIQQSPGWVHYMIHGPERHIMLFRRKLEKPKTITTTSQQTAKSVGIKN
uniref:Cyclin-dependent kinases regulatory subunit n=1 Tax=Syphacia muris TaxID=451379 RepID=A0A0N5AQA3_9BILA